MARLRRELNISGYPELAAIVGSIVPNYRGMFLRGHGSQNHIQNNGSNVGNTGTTHASGNLGAVQGDAARRFSAYLPDIAIGYSRTGWRNLANSTPEINGSVSRHVNGIRWSASANSGESLAYGFDKRTNIGFYSFMTLNSAIESPTAAENRPANMAVKYIIRAKE